MLYCFLLFWFIYRCLIHPYIDSYKHFALHENTSQYILNFVFQTFEQKYCLFTKLWRIGRLDMHAFMYLGTILLLPLLFFPILESQFLGSCWATLIYLAKISFVQSYAGFSRYIHTYLPIVYVHMYMGI